MTSPSPSSGSSKRPLEHYSKDELIALVKDLRRRKRFGLVWKDKPEDVVEQCARELPVLEEVSERTIEAAAGKPTNLIIEGDNYHALSVLNYTHAGKVDVIYIDLPTIQPLLKIQQQICLRRRPVDALSIAFNDERAQ